MFDKEIYNRVVELLALHKDLDTQALFEQLQPLLTISLPNFYKIIAAMIQAQILVKNKGKLRLHANFLIYLRRLYHTIQDNYMQDADISYQLSANERREYYASTLFELDSIRSEISSHLTLLYKGEQSVINYNAHPYHVLGMPDQELNTMRQRSSNSPAVYFLFGNETFLDHYGKTLLDPIPKFHVKCSAQHKFITEGYFLNIIGEYIVEVLLPVAISDYFKIFFQNIHDQSNFSTELFHRIFTMKDSFKLTYRYDPNQAVILRQEILSFFK